MFLTPSSSCRASTDGSQSASSSQSKNAVLSFNATAGLRLRRCIFGGLAMSDLAANSWRDVVAQGFQALVVMALVAIGVPAHAGTNNWTYASGGGWCNGSVSTGQIKACVDATMSPSSDYCGNVRVSWGPTEVAPSEYHVQIAWDIDPTHPYDNCDALQQQGGGATAEWKFTVACASGFEWSGAYGGCGESCDVGETLIPADGVCVPLSTEVIEDRSDGNGGVCKGNPCDILSGNKNQREVDYAPGTGVLAFARTYNSLRHHAAKEGAYGRPLGESWFGSYFQFISAASGLNSSVVDAVRPTGDVIAFTAPVPGSTSTAYEAAGEIRERLVVATDISGGFVGWRYVAATDDVELYDTSGRLVSIKNRGGVTQTLSYGSNSRLESVSDDFG